MRLINLKEKNKTLKVFWLGRYGKRNITDFTEAVEWEGSDTQTSRKATVSVAYNPYKKLALNLKLGDRIYLKENAYLFYGVVTSAERTGAIGTVKYMAKDYMHYLLRSTGSYNFKQTTPEEVTEKVCSDLQIMTEGVYRTGIYLESLLFEEINYYKMIVEAYNQAARKQNPQNPAAFMPVMRKDRLGVVVKGQSSGRTLYSDRDITKSSYSMTSDSMVDRVKIVNSSGEQIGEEKDEGNIQKYGIYQSIYKEEKGVNPSDAARQLLSGVTKEASVEAVGFCECVAGTSVKIYDSASGLTGKFYIENDKHTWKDGVHTMNLSLKFRNGLEEV